MNTTDALSRSADDAQCLAYLKEIGALARKKWANQLEQGELDKLTGWLLGLAVMSASGKHSCGHALNSSPTAHARNLQVYVARNGPASVMQQTRTDDALGAADKILNGDGHCYWEGATSKISQPN